MKVPGGTVFQHAHIVNDLKAGMKRWVETHGIGPFYYLENLTVGPDCYSHRGKPATLNFGMAMCQLESIQIELIVQYDDLPTAYRDVYKKGQEGFHHLGIIPHDFDASVAHYKALGYETAHNGFATGLRFHYFDGRRDFGCMIELVEDVPASRKVTAMLRDAAINWDGKDPYRLLTLPPEAL